MVVIPYSTEGDDVLDGVELTVLSKQVISTQ
jgi:hypothetical protein